MGKSWLIGRVQGIPILIHWSLGLFVLFFIYIAHQQNFALAEILWFGGFIICLFLCIVLHELGHALTAKAYQIPTKDIILSPIGGLARLEKTPDIPIQEFWIAINGPLVNIGISLLLSAGFFLFGIPILPDISGGLIITNIISFLQVLLWMNLMVFLFNLIPAFPMDGGRILRALLRLKFDRVKATSIAVHIGRFFAISFIVFSVFYSQLILGVIGLFIYFMAGQELRHVKLSNLLSAGTIRDLTLNDNSHVYPTDLFSDVQQKMKETNLKNFLVIDNESNIIGSLPEWFIKEALKGPEKYKQVSDLMSNNHQNIDVNTSLEFLFNIMQNEGLAIVSVLENEKVIGSVDRDQLSQYIARNS